MRLSCPIKGKTTTTACLQAKQIYQTQVADAIPGGKDSDKKAAEIR